MKLISERIRLKRKTLLIFFIALVLPLIIVAYLGFDTLSERHRSTKNILKSNLWITGESALNQLEDELKDLEANTLSMENFKQLSAESLPESKSGTGNIGKDKHHFSPFLLAEDLSVVYPKTGTWRDDIISRGRNSSAEFDKAFSQAELYEFQQRNFVAASEGYQRCYALASSDQDQAYALEGLARTSMLQAKYEEAVMYYDLLKTKYSSIMNGAGHPYGIIGLIQLYEINKTHTWSDNLQSEFIETYEKLKDGYWKLSASSYGFFVSEIERILESGFLNDPLQQQLYISLRNKASGYGDDLEFVEVLRADIINRISEAQILNFSENDPQTRRVIYNQNGEWSLISFRQFMNFLEGEHYTGGIKWETETLRESIIPEILERISVDSGLELFLSDDRTPGSRSGYNYEDTLSLSFRSFPIPWKLNVIQSAIFTIEQESRKEMTIYGLLLGMVFILMTLGAILIARDIKREADSMNMKTEFVHNVSHELKTPLSLIRLYGETLLIKENLTALEKTDALQVITKESERLSHMINNILDFSNIEMGRKEFNFKKGDFGKTIQDTLDSYHYHLEKEGFKIFREISSDLPLINYDKEAIEGLLINLLSNAIKYSPQKKELTIKLHRENDHILLQVSDKGMGITPSELSHIFNRFYRTRQQVGFESRGSGLGLTLVKHIVESHEGSIQVTSKPGEGSTFTLKFPVSKRSFNTQT